jgi:F5/8 type C domain.
MKTTSKISRSSILISAFAGLSAFLAISTSQSLQAADQMVPLALKLPEPAFKGTPKEIQLSKFVEPYDPDKKRPPFMVPEGVVNLVAGKKPTSSDTNATESILTKITDGDKEPSDQSIIYLRKGTQWIQFDLGAPSEIYAILVWHAHNAPKVYHSVIVQFSDDPAFKENVKTIYNNDQENKSGLGVGTDREYFETNEGRLIDAKGAKTRYVRLYSKGSTESALNEYTEVEIYGRPAK